MDRSGFPVEIAISLIVLAAFLYVYRQLPAVLAAPAPTTAQAVQ